MKIEMLEIQMLFHSNGLNWLEAFDADGSALRCWVVRLKMLVYVDPLKKEVGERFFKWNIDKH